MTRDELPTHADLIRPKGTPTTAYQAIAYNADESVAARGKLRLRVEDTDGDVLELVAKDPDYIVRVVSTRVYDKGVSGARAAGERESMPTKKKMVKRAPAKRVAQKRKVKATIAKPTANGQGALDLAALKSGSKIFGVYKGQKQEATIITNASKDRRIVLYRGNEYKSLSGAARAVIEHVSGKGSGARLNGRTFWQSA